MIDAKEIIRELILSRCPKREDTIAKHIATVLPNFGLVNWFAEALTRRPVRASNAESRFVCLNDLYDVN